MNYVTQDHIDRYRADGVVCLRRVVDEVWLKRLQEAASSIIDDPGSSGGIVRPSHGGMVSISFMWRQPGVIRDFIFESSIGETVGKVIGAEHIRIFHDHLFSKPPMSPMVMPWHLDATVWPTKGEMAPNIWIALSPVNQENGRIEFLAGYHQYCVENKIEYGMKPEQGDGLCPDFEGERNNPDFPHRFVTWDLEPGDAVVFHPSTPHYSKGNCSPDAPRSGLALRMFGDDATWNTEPSYKMEIPGIAYDSIHDGDSINHELLPVVWERDSQRSN